jgi:CRP-like cAMP-binding protein
LDNHSSAHDLQAFVSSGAIPLEVAQQLAHIGTVRTFAQDEVLCREGDDGDSMFLLIEGSAVVQRLADAQTDRYETLGICEAGSTIGEIALFDGKPRTATVRAREPVRALRLEREAVKQFLEASATQAMGLLSGLLKLQNVRLRKASQYTLTLSEILRVVTETSDLEQVAHRVLECLKGGVGHLSEAAFCAFDELHEECAVVAALGMRPEQGEVLCISRSGPLARTLREQDEALMLSNLDAEHPLVLTFALTPHDHVLLAPLRYDGRLLGYLILIGRSRPFGAFHRLLVDTAVAPLGSLIVNHQHARENEARRRLERVRGHRVPPAR